MNKAATARADKPIGQTALEDALAEFGISPNAADGFGTLHGALSAKSGHTAAGAAQAHSELPPKTVSQVLGEITWLMTQSPRHKSISLGDLEWLVMPAIQLRQFRIFYKGEQPVGVAFWALVDDIVAGRIDANDKRLSVVEWKSGANIRIIDEVAPFGGVAEMREQIKCQWLTAQASECIGETEMKATVE
jgi:cytolysin-activating lysine-acyltransferase